MSYAGKGGSAQALEHAERGVKLSPESNFMRAILGAVYAMAGHDEAARRILADLLERSRQSYVAPILISWIYSNLQDRDSAFRMRLAKPMTSYVYPRLGSASRCYDANSVRPQVGELVQRLH